MSATNTSPQPGFIETRQVGRATLHIVSDGELRFAPRFPVPEADARRAMPEADEAGRIWLGMNIVLLEVDGARIIVDPGLDDPGTSFDAKQDVRRSQGLAVALAALGWAPTEVTQVVITHAHGDHYAGVMVERDGALAIRFPNARHYLGRADWQGNPQREASTSDLSQRLGAIERAGLLDLVDEELEIVPGVRVARAPGESPGHQVVWLTSAGESLCVLGDVVHHRCEVDHLDWAPRHADVPQLVATRRGLYTELARTGALAVVKHVPFPGLGHVTGSRESFRWEPV